MRTNNSTLILLFSAILAFSCQKEYSCEGAACWTYYDDGKAIYSFLQISNGNCEKTDLYGSYGTGIALNDSNYVNVRVHISKAGTYNFSTDTVNGFYFISQGLAADTGFTNFVLKGIGKPLKSGYYNFITSIVSGCGFTVKVDTTIDIEKYYYSFTLDGQSNNLTVGVEGVINFLNSGTPMPLTAGLTNGSLLEFPSGASMYRGLYIDKGYINHADLTQNGLASFFAVGPYTLAAHSTSSYVAITWWPDNSGSWSTNNSPGTQDASNFNITSVETFVDNNGIVVAKVKATFNCNLYSRYGTKAILTNGKFYGEFSNSLR